MGLEHTVEQVGLWLSGRWGPLMGSEGLARISQAVLYCSTGLKDPGCVPLSLRDMGKT